MTVETFELDLPHGIRLACRACGPADAPRLLLLHGFPEAAFIWDELMQTLGQRWRCIAPDLRGYGGSSRPPEVEAYRAKHLVADLVALIEQTGGAPLEALVAHDWGGAVAWNLAVQRPELMRRLVIINSPHPATFLHALQHDTEQQAASAYMNFFCRADAEALLAENDYARLWPFFNGPDGTAPWLDEALRQRFRALWDQGLTGPLNYYRASPMRPATAADPAAAALSFAPEFVTVKVPTLVIWGEQDHALLPVLLDRLERYVPQLTIERVPDAGHWIVHQQPARVAQLIEQALDQGRPMNR